MKNFIVKELIYGWEGQATDLKDALRQKAEIIAGHGADNVEVYIMAEVDETDLEDQWKIELFDRCLALVKA